ncbi:hypothetical protein ACIQ2D_19085 [Lysinibacillus sp. NPDC097287]|uniref:hypothetical protein n=1 Tax=Lysinibacillus sp. NPDC097287 TaxID=3364144 RepID=UPI00382396E1
MNFCPTCGRKRHENAKYCYECGYNFSLSLPETNEKEGQTSSTKNEISQEETPIYPFKCMEGWEEGWSKLTSCLWNIREVNQSTIRIVFDGQIKRETNAGKVASAIYTYFNYDYYAVKKFVFSEWHRNENFEFIENYSSNKSRNYNYYSKRNQNSNDFLDVVEMIVDYSSPRSAIKRIIKNLKE